jgi:hypothetical protein
MIDQVLLGNFDAEAGRENIFRMIVGMRVYMCEISNNSGIRVVNCAI